MWKLEVLAFAIEYSNRPAKFVHGIILHAFTSTLMLKDI
jgi:hypothetical protein